MLFKPIAAYDLLEQVQSPIHLAVIRFFIVKIRLIKCLIAFCWRLAALQPK